MAIRKLNYEMMDNPTLRPSVSQQMAASCTGALITSLMVTPFDVVKIRMQSQQKLLLSNKCFLYCNGLMDHLCPCNLNEIGNTNQKLWLEKSSTHFKGTFDAFVKITRQEGITSLWSGLSPTLVLAIPATVIYFVSYENLRLFFKDRNKGIQPGWAPFAGGIIARTFSVITVSPLELIRTKMQSQKLTYLEIGQAIKSLVQFHGLTGLFRGLQTTLLRDVPFSAIYWTSYENIKRNFAHNLNPTLGFSFLAGAFSGSIAAFLTTPFDVVKTHQQIDLGEKEIYTGILLALLYIIYWVFLTCLQPYSQDDANLQIDKPSKGGSMRSIMTKIYSSNGISGLFTGLAPRLIRVAPACAIMMSTFEYGKLYFIRYNQKQYMMREMEL